MKREEEIRERTAPGLIRFESLAPEATPGAPPPNTFPTAEVIEQLRQRLLNQHGDSLDTKVAIVGEIAYFAFRELMKRRVL